MDDRTKEALLGSIAKWEAIVAGHGEDKGVDNCALCQMFWHDRCKGCPVAAKTGEIHCVGSPYDAWGGENGEEYTPLNDADEEDREDFKKLAQAELDFLISLLPPED